MRFHRTFDDHIGNPVTFLWPPSRIVSLVPSQTELLADLNLSKEVVGITKYCVWPTQWRKTKVVVGGTKNFSIDKILDLKPDLVIGNKEENQKELIELLSIRVPVWMSDIATLEDATQMISDLGLTTNRYQEAEIINRAISESFKSFIPIVKTQVKILYLIWRKPWIGVGSNTFISSMLQRIGFVNCLENEERYPILDLNKLPSLNPDYIFLSSEPYPFIEKHKTELEAVFPASKILLVDGEMFSWYGSRLLKSVDYFRSLNL